MKKSGQNSQSQNMEIWVQMLVTSPYRLVDTSGSLCGGEPGVRKGRSGMKCIGRVMCEEPGNGRGGCISLAMHGEFRNRMAGGVTGRERGECAEEHGVLRNSKVCVCGEGRG